MTKLKKLGLLLLCLGLLPGCAKTEAPVATVDRAALCKDWQHQTISKRDTLTDQTATQIEANNKSRPAWGCAYGKQVAEARP